ARRLPAARAQRRPSVARRFPRPPGFVSCRECKLASAGRGLPAVQPGMPAPPGPRPGRPEPLPGAPGPPGGVSGGAGPRPEAVADGIAAARAAGTTNRVLVSVFLEGGADSLSLLFPDGDPLYRKLRPKLALAPDAGVAFAEDDRLRWHPSLAPFAALH